MSFNFDEFDLDIAKALDEVPTDITIDEYLAQKHAVQTEVPIVTIDQERFKRMTGIQGLGSLSTSYGLKSAS